MKILLLIFAINLSYAGTCTSISRTNYSSNQVLTSASLNSQLNTVYGAANALDGGCVTDGTLEVLALNATDWATPLRAIQQGCSVSYSDANTVIISRCYSSVNGAWVAKSTTTSVAMGCGSCSADSASTTYYVYIATGSTGSSVTGLISTTAPNADGYDNSGNKVLARFYNNASSAIDQYSIDQWVVNRFVPTNTTDITYTPTGSWSANTTYTGKFRRVGAFMVAQVKVATSGAPTSATLTIDIPSGYLIDHARFVDSTQQTVVSSDGVCIDTSGGGTNYECAAYYFDTNTVTILHLTSSTTTISYLPVTQAAPFTWGASDSSGFNFSVPIVGWND